MCENVWGVHTTQCHAQKFQNESITVNQSVGVRDVERERGRGENKHACEYASAWKFVSGGNWSGGGDGGGDGGGGGGGGGGGNTRAEPA